MPTRFEKTFPSRLAKARYGCYNTTMIVPNRKSKLQRVFISVALTIVLCFAAFSFVGCLNEKTDQYGFFTQWKLITLRVPKLPKIQSDQPTKMDINRFLYMTTEEEFNDYINRVYEYLISRSFPYLWTAVQTGSFFGGAGSFRLEQAAQLSDYNQGDETEPNYFFVWGRKSIFGDEPAFVAYLRAVYHSRTFELDGVAFNAEITLPSTKTLDATFHIPKD